MKMQCATCERNSTHTHTNTMPTRMCARLHYLFRLQKIPQRIAAVYDVCVCVRRVCVRVYEFSYVCLDMRTETSNSETNNDRIRAYKYGFYSRTKKNCTRTPPVISSWLGGRSALGLEKAE